MCDTKKREERLGKKTKQKLQSSTRKCTWYSKFLASVQLIVITYIQCFLWLCFSGGMVVVVYPSASLYLFVCVCVSLSMSQVVRRATPSWCVHLSLSWQRQRHSAYSKVPSNSLSLSLFQSPTTFPKRYFMGMLLLSLLPWRLLLWLDYHGLLVVRLVLLKGKRGGGREERRGGRKNKMCVVGFLRCYLCYHVYTAML